MLCALYYSTLITYLEIFWMVVVFPTSAANNLEWYFASHGFETNVNVPVYMYVRDYHIYFNRYRWLVTLTVTEQL